MDSFMRNMQHNLRFDIIWIKDISSALWLCLMSACLWFLGPAWLNSETNKKQLDEVHKECNFVEKRQQTLYHSQSSVPLMPLSKINDLKWAMATYLNWILRQSGDSWLLLFTFQLMSFLAAWILRTEEFIRIKQSHIHPNYRLIFITKSDLVCFLRGNFDSEASEVAFSISVMKKYHSQNVFLIIRPNDWTT